MLARVHVRNAPLLLAIVGSLVIVSPCAAAEAEPEKLSYEILVQRVRWPVHFDAEWPGACNSLEPDDLRLYEDDQRVRVAQIERERLPTLHAILMDTSASMVGRMDQAKTAAVRYLSGLLPGERVMVAGFHDNVELASPLTERHDRAERAIHRLRNGTGTALWDGLNSIMRYLEPYSERKVLVLVSDGCDTTSLPQQTFARVKELAARLNGLSIYTIGLALGKSCPGLELSPAEYLTELATNSGGRFFEVEKVEELAGPFRMIRDRIDNEGYVVYEPNLPDARDGPGGWRSIRVESASLRCQVVSADPRGRRVGAPESTPTQPLGLTRSKNGAETRLRLPVIWPTDEPQDDSYLALQTRRLHGRFVDLTAEAGVYDAEAYEAGSFELTRGRPPAFTTRPVTIDLPDFDQARTTLTSPLAILLHLIERDQVPVFIPTEPDSPETLLPNQLPLLINGHSFLLARQWLGQAMLEHPPYREWMLSERRARILRDVDRMIAEHGENVSNEVAQSIREEFLARAGAPAPGEAQLYLAEWLGDATARSLAYRLELELTNRLIRDKTGLLAKRWPGFVDVLYDQLFDPPRRVRVVALMVPSYSTELDALGFYRIRLSQPTDGGPPREAIPPPLGLITMDWLLQEPGAQQTFQGKVAVRSMRFGPMPANEREGLKKRFNVWEGAPADGGAAVMSIVLEKNAPRETPAHLRVLYDASINGGGHPVAVTVEIPRGQTWPELEERRLVHTVLKGWLALSNPIPPEPPR